MAAGKRKPKAQLGTTLVSSTLHELVKDMESQAMKVEAATYYKQRDEAYAQLSVTRTSLYHYVADLERRAGIKQSTTLRF